MAFAGPFPDDEDQQPKYQVINGFRIAVPGGAGADSDYTPNPTGGMMRPVDEDGAGALRTTRSTPQPPSISDASRAAGLGPRPISAADHEKAMSGKGGAGPEDAPTAAEFTNSGLRVRKPQPLMKTPASPPMTPPLMPTISDASRAASSINIGSVLAPNRMPPAPAPIAEAAAPGRPSFADAASQWAKTGARIDPRDPATGKMKPEYRMGLGSRILGSIANFAVGFGGGKRPVMYVGPGATNARYSNDEAQRESEHQAAGEQLSEYQKEQQANESLFDKAARAAYQGQVAQAREDTAAAQQQNADTRAKLAEATAELNRAKAAKPPDKLTADADSRAAMAEKYGLKGEARRDFILTGKLPKEFAPRAKNELETWMDAFRSQYHREPTPEEIGVRHRSLVYDGLTPGEQRLLQSKTRRLDDERKQLLQDRSLELGENDQDGKNKLAAIDKRLDEIYNEIDKERDAIISGRGSKQVRTLDRTTAAQYLERAGGDKAKARQMAKADGWSF